MAKPYSVQLAAGGAGRGHLIGPHLDEVVQKVSEGDEVVHRESYARPDHFFRIDPTAEKIGGAWSGMGECQGGKIAMRMNIEPSVAQSFWDVVRINYLRVLLLLQRVWHDKPRGFEKQLNGW
jgi:hypothetical protein